MEPRLTVQDLACRRGDRLLFRGLSFDLECGELLQIVGANGTGKSSLLRILAGLLRPFAGSVSTSGRVALLDERLPLDEHLALEESFAFWDRIDRDASTANDIASVGLTGLADVPVRYLSTGQRKRAALLHAIATKPEIWLFDEPLNGLDAAGAAMLLNEIRAFRADGGIAIVASHQPVALDELRTLDLANYAG